MQKSHFCCFTPEFLKTVFADIKRRTPAGKTLEAKKVDAEELCPKSFLQVLKHLDAHDFHVFIYCYLVYLRISFLTINLISDQKP